MPSISSKITAVAFASAALIAGVINVNPASAIEISFTQEFEKFVRPGEEGEFFPKGILQVTLIGEDTNSDGFLATGREGVSGIEDDAEISFSFSFKGADPEIPDLPSVNLPLDEFRLNSLELFLSNSFRASNLNEFTLDSIDGTVLIGGSGESTQVTYNPTPEDENSIGTTYISTGEITLVPESSTVAGLAGLVILTSLGFAKKKLLS